MGFLGLHEALLPILIAASLLVLPSTLATDIKYCDNSDYAVKVKDVDISPNPVVSGKVAKFRIAASTEEAITGGNLKIGVSYYGVPIHSENHDLCKETSCPVTSGDFVLSHEQTLPGFTPPGPYTLKMRLYAKDGSQLTCITFDFKIKRGSTLSDS
ncbi:hypothetical protein QJS10_CPA08g00041 [Acorus calamus]|uniref:MD-2-related lipid-recognition domain-containing protein n=1 Tax=Acorus calamus TaxID=4465 RepID=A0AAV9EAN4_ACOCL|nr:hypothetical protein QJS10_CPA08g00041 [Acorus calamus]